MLEMLDDNMMCFLEAGVCLTLGQTALQGSKLVRSPPAFPRAFVVLIKLVVFVGHRFLSNRTYQPHISASSKVVLIIPG